jgi:hypothetical protein
MVITLHRSQTAVGGFVTFFTVKYINGYLSSLSAAKEEDSAILSPKIATNDSMD